MPLRHPRLPRNVAGAQAVSVSAPSPLNWHAEALREHLDVYLPGISVEVLARAESTNTLLLERARQGSGRRDAPVTTPGELQALRSRGDDGAEGSGPFGRRAGDTQPALLIAEHQTLGRGRQGRAWQAGPGASLTFSLGLPLAPHDWSGLSLAVGLALADALEAPQPDRTPRLQLKWPNDLWLADASAASGIGRKLGGVLIETVAVGSQRMVVVGVGLNISALPAWQTRELASGFASLDEIDASASAPAALHRVALPLVQSLRQFEREGFVGFAPAYARRDLLRGRCVSAQVGAVGEPPLSGTVEGVSNSGALLVRVGPSLRLVSSGDVSVAMHSAVLAPGDRDAG
jgi:BirA family biotin operon repressor/biotin-[acetyl-CoA-carboxylase] ligase